MKSIIDNIVEGSSVTAQTGNALTQNVSNPKSTTAVGVILEELCQQLHDKINFEINNHPIQQIGLELRKSMTAMKNLF